MTVTVGSPIQLAWAFTDGDGNPVIPASATVTITPLATGTPGSPLTATVNSDGLATYTYTPATAGQYSYYFESATPTLRSTPDVFTVAGLTTGSLISLAEAKAFNQIRGNSNDAQISSFIQSATAIIDAKCGVTVPTQFTEIVPTSMDLQGHLRLMVSKLPLLAVTSIAPVMNNITQVDISTLKFIPESGVVFLANYWPWIGPQTIVYTAGRSVVPPELRDACQIIVGSLWETQRGGATAVPNQDNGEGTMQSDWIPPKAWALMRQAGKYAAPGIA